MSRAAIDDELRRILARYRKREPDLYRWLEYFEGFRDDKMRNARSHSGARLRSRLMLQLREAYGVRGTALAAAALEFFHEFTLIHDDIVDRDRERRGRATLWVKAGQAVALNAGDAQLIIATELASRCTPPVREILFNAFSDVCEGQHLDFTLSSMSLSKAQERGYMRMIRKKTAALIAAAAETAGASGQRTAAERKKLRAFGEALGVAYQLRDDFRSIWAQQATTKKDAQSDIRERKRTLPILRAYARSSRQVRNELAALYGRDGQLSARDIARVRSRIDTTDAQEYTERRIRDHAERALRIGRTLNISAARKKDLAELVAALTRPE